MNIIGWSTQNWPFLPPAVQMGSDPAAQRIAWPTCGRPAVEFDVFNVPCHSASLRWSTSDRSANRRHCCLSPTAPSPEGHYPSASTRRPIVKAESKRSRVGQLLVHAKLHTRLEECELALPNAMSTSPASVCGASNRYGKVDGEAAAHVQSVHSLCDQRTWPPRQELPRRSNQQRT